MHRSVQRTHFTVCSDRASLRLLSEIFKPNGRLMNWRICLILFEIEVKKAFLNTQTDALIRLQSLYETEPLVDLKVHPCLVLSVLPLIDAKIHSN